MASEGVLRRDQRHRGLLHLEGGDCFGLPGTELNGGGVEL